jgi:hypothetical protein
MPTAAVYPVKYEIDSLNLSLTAYFLSTERLTVPPQLRQGMENRLQKNEEVYSCDRLLLWKTSRYTHLSENISARYWRNVKFVEEV